MTVIVDRQGKLTFEISHGLIAAAITHIGVGNLQGIVLGRQANQAPVGMKLPSPIKGAHCIAKISETNADGASDIQLSGDDAAERRK
jgi:hypothetical protein